MFTWFRSLRFASAGVLLFLVLGVPCARARLLRAGRIVRAPGVLVWGPRRLLEQPVLRRIVGVWLAHPGSRLVLEPPAGVYGRVWAADLRSWLVAFGIPAERISVRPGLRRGAALGIEVRGYGP